ncbi:hypothetical protein [Prescottella equi]|uniref:Minor tail protein n=1 Tax=Prescottella equi ATCC 33707 TaxID=525370 RepID=E9T058_RHOHA|nr:hypothetical protein [Prescottella equi]EGD24641.1 hypothetical protein HMPREF0724_11759 [Prescottella equi ATCC 33707]
MSPIEFQHITGAWMITDYDSRDDQDALPEQQALKGTCTFRARFDPSDRAAAIHVPDPAGSYLLSVREMVFPIVHGRLIDREARDGVMLPAVIGGVPIVWTATPELQEDPGTGIQGARVPANAIVFGPADPDAAGDRRINLADVADTNIDYPEPVVSRVAVLVKQAIDARDEIDGFVQYITDEVVPDIASKAEAAREHAEQAGRYAQQAFEAIPPATDTQLGKIKLRGDLGGTAEEPTVPELSGKRDVVAGTNRVYTTDGSGTQSNVPYSSSATATTIMLRDTSGRTKVASPSAATDATNKDYVDTGLAKKANLGPDGKIVQAELPAIAMVDFLGNVASETAMLALVGQRGDWCNRTDLGTEWQLIAEPSSQKSSWMEKIYPASDVRSVNGRKGAIELSSLDVLDSTPTGRALMKADDQASARAVIDAASQAYMIALEQTLDAYFNALNLRDAGAWSPSTGYDVGQVVTYNHGRYYCRDGHGPSATFPAANYVWIGAAIVAATSDPGGGRLWVKI